jgi:hypothetical protein
MNTVSKLIMILVDSKHHCGYPDRVRANGGQMVNGVLAQAHLLVDPVGSQAHPVFISTLQESIIGKDILQSGRISALATVDTEDRRLMTTGEKSHDSHSQLRHYFLWREKAYITYIQ